MEWILLPVYFWGKELGFNVIRIENTALQVDFGLDKSHFGPPSWQPPPSSYHLWTLGTSAVPNFGSAPSLLLQLWCSVWPRCYSALVPPVFRIKLPLALRQALLFRNSRLARVFITDFLFFKSFPPVPVFTSLLLSCRCISRARFVTVDRQSWFNGVSL